MRPVTAKNRLNQSVDNMAGGRIDLNMNQSEFVRECTMRCISRWLNKCLRGYCAAMKLRAARGDVIGCPTNSLARATTAGLSDRNDTADQERRTYLQL